MSRRESLLRKLVFFIHHQFPLIILVSIFLTIVSLLVSGFFLTTKTGRLDLISDKNPSSQRFLDFLNQFGSPDQLVILVEGGDRQDREKAVTTLAEELVKEKKWVESVFYRIPIEFFQKYGLQYADLETLQTLSVSVNQLQDSLQASKGALDLVSLFQKVDTDLKQSFKQKKGLSGKEDMMHLKQFVEKMKEAIQDPDSPVDFSFFENANQPYDIFITSKSKDVYFLFVKPTESKNDFKFIKVFLKQVRRVIANLNMPGIHVELTGVPPIIYEETVTTARDVTKASIVSFIGITLLFIFSFHAFRKPLMVVIVLLMGVSFTFCFATLAVGSLNMMSIVFVPMLIGLGIDFGVHILMRYREERLRGHSPKEAIEVVVVHTGRGILSGAITTAAVFFTLVFSDFKGFSEFGLISGGGVLICCFAMLIVVPAFLLLWEKSGRGKKYYELFREKNQLRMPHVAKLLHYPKTVIALSLVITVYLFFQIKDVKFNGSLLDIQAKNPKSFLVEKKMMEDSPLSPRFAAVLAKNLEEVKQKETMLKKLSVVSHVESILSVLPKENHEEQLDALKEMIQKINIQENKEKIETQKLYQTLRHIQNKLVLVDKHVPDDKRKEVEWLFDFQRALDDLLLAWNQQSEARLAASLKTFENDWIGQTQEHLLQLKKMLQEPEVTVDLLPLEVKERYIGKNGDYLLMVYPKKSVWHDEELIRFTEAIKRVEPQATGTPFLIRTVTQLMEHGYKKAGWIAFVVVLLILLLDFRKGIPTLLALIPLVMGVIWMLGLMGMIGVKFNPANIVAVPLILGIAIDNGVHLVHRFYEHKAHRVDDIMKSTTKAVYLNAITTMVCFGALMLASHRGIASLGFVLVLGLTTCLVTSITFLPAVMTLMTKKKAKG